MDINEREKLRLFDGTVLKRLLKFRKERLQNEGKKVTLEKLKDDLAELICVSKETINNWLKGYNNPNDYSIVLALAKEFNVKPEEFEKPKYVKDVVISMAENKLSNTNIVMETNELNNSDNAIEQFKLISGAMNDMVDSMKKFQEIIGANKTAVTSVYHDVSDFLETYRKLEHGTGSNILSDKFNTMYSNIRKLRLEIPGVVFDKLEKFITEYLFMLTGCDSIIHNYLKDLDLRKDDVIDFVKEYGYRLRIEEIDKPLWEEYLELKNLIVNKASSDIEYKDYISELASAYEFEYEEGSFETEDYEFAAIYMLNLYQWITNVWDMCPSVKYDGLIEKSKHFKSTCISNAYRHLDGILSIYIP